MTADRRRRRSSGNARATGISLDEPSGYATRAVAHGRTETAAQQSRRSAASLGRSL